MSEAEKLDQGACNETFFKVHSSGRGLARSILIGLLCSSFPLIIRAESSPMESRDVSAQHYPFVTNIETMQMQHSSMINDQSLSGASDVVRQKEALLTSNSGLRNHTSLSTSRQRDSTPSRPPRNGSESLSGLTTIGFTKGRSRVRISRYVVRFPTRPGMQEALSWCQGGLEKSILKSLAGFLTNPLSMSESSTLASSFESQYDPNTADLRLNGNYWSEVAKMCFATDNFFDGNRKTEGSLWSKFLTLIDPLAPEVMKFENRSKIRIEGRNNRIEKDSIESDWCRLLQLTNPGQRRESAPGDLASLLPHELLMGPEGFSNTSTIVSDISRVILRLLGHGEINLSRDLRPSDEALLAMTHILRIFRRLFFLPSSATNLESKFSYITDSICRLSDIESLIPDKDSPVTCLIVDIAYTFTACTSSIESRGLNQNCTKGTEALSTIISKQSALSGKYCFTPSLVLQRKHDNNNLRLFQWDDKDLSIPLQLQDSRSTPDKISPLIRNSELLTYMTFWRAIMIQYGYAQFACNQNLIDGEEEILPGWKVIALISTRLPAHPGLISRALQNETPKMADVPFLTISYSDQTPCQYVVVAKGTSHQSEWILDFHYWRSPPYYNVPPRNMNLPNGRRTSDPSWLEDQEGVHGGFQTYVNLVSPLIMSEIEALSQEQQCTCENTIVQVSGHSLGGAVAHLLSFNIAGRYHAAGCPIRVDSVAFGAPRVFSGQYLRQKAAEQINMRSIIDVQDILYRVPCYAGNSFRGFPRCGRYHAMIRGVGMDLFHDNPGAVIIDADVGAAPDQRNKRSMSEFFRSMSEGTTTIDAILKKAERASSVMGKGMDGAAAMSPSFGSLSFKRQLQEVFDSRASHISDAWDEELMRGEALGYQGLETISIGTLFHVLGNIGSKLVAWILPAGLLDNFPQRWEVISAHFNSYACALSWACRAAPASRFHWWCNASS